MPSKDGWTHERDHEKVQLGKKQYRNMEEWSRPCAVCGEKFSIFTRTNGQSVNSAFGLKTCKEHRGQAIGGGSVNVERIAELEAELKETQQSQDEVLRKFGQVRKAIHEQLGLSLLGDAISYDTVTAAIRKLKGEHELPAALREAAENKMPWQ